MGKACTVIEEETGVNLKEIAEIIKTGNETATEQIAKTITMIRILISKKLYRSCQIQ